MQSDILKQILNQKKEEAVKTFTASKPKEEPQPEKKLDEGENLSKIVGYSKAHPELADALAQLIKGYLAKTNVNVTSLVNKVVKDTGVNKAQLMAAVDELGLSELAVA